MSEPLPHRALYAAFDRFPSPKGAAIHISQWADELFRTFGGGILHVLGGGDLPAYQLDAGPEGGTVETIRFVTPVENLLDRTVAYSAQLGAVVDAHRATLELCHVRDPWSALAVLSDRAHDARVVFEVNGLPSIELPYSYPALAPSTLDKVRALERRCLREADVVLTPSSILVERLIDMGADTATLRVIRNGAEVPADVPRPPDAPARYLVYVGALQPWQGVDVLLRAFARLADLPDVHLVICSASKAKVTRPYQRLARRLEIEDRVHWHIRLPHDEIAGWLAHAVASVAPLTDCSRNVDQGCCPLKVIESMAVATPVVASDLPVLRELVEDGVHGRLVAPERPAELARALRILLEYPDLATTMGEHGRALVEASLTWQESRARLRACYESLLAAR